MVADDYALARATELLRTGQPAAALAAFTKALAASPQDVRLLSGRAECHLALGKPGSALVDARAAEALRPRYAAAARLRAAAEAATAAATSSSAARATASVAAGRAVGNAALAAGDAAGAEAAYTAALASLRAAAAAAAAVVAAARSGGGPSSSTLADSKTPPGAPPCEEALLLSNRSAARLTRGDAAGAEADAADAARLAPGWAKGRARLAAALLARRHWAAAAEAATVALGLDPSHAGAAECAASAAAALAAAGEAEAGYAAAATALKRCGATGGAANPAAAALRRARAAALDVVVRGDTSATAARRSRFALDAGRDPRGVRVFVVSDLHVDVGSNLEWCRALSPTAFRGDVLIVAGDVGDTLVALKAALKVLRPKFRRLVVCFGNHDAWVRPQIEDRLFPDSVAKLCACAAACDAAGADVGPVTVAAGLVVAPLWSWYDAGFDEADPHPGGLRFDSFASWPPEHAHDPAALLLRMNKRPLAEAGLLQPDPRAAAAPNRPARVVISCSHFLPRAELPVAPVPELRKAVGCKRLDGLVERLGSAVHAFGHTHLNTDTTCGARYVAAGKDGALRPVGAANETRYVQSALEGGARRGLYCVYSRGALAGWEVPAAG